MNRGTYQTSAGYMNKCNSHAYMYDGKCRISLKRRYATRIQSARSAQQHAETARVLCFLWRILRTNAAGALAASWRLENVLSAPGSPPPATACDTRSRCIGGTSMRTGRRLSAAAEPLGILPATSRCHISGRSIADIPAHAVGHSQPSSTLHRTDCPMAFP